MANSIVESLINLLEAGDEADRCNAARTLGMMREVKANSVLLARLRDEDVDVCVDAAVALGEIASPQSMAALTQSTLHDPSAEVRVAAIEALGNLGVAGAADILIHCMTTRPEHLEVLEDGNWDPWWDMQLKAVRALGQIGSQSAVPAMIQLLESEDVEDIEEELLQALAKIGGDGEAYLVKSLSSANARQRRRIARVLSQSKTADACQALLSGLEDRDADVRVAVLRALQDFHFPVDIEPLLFAFVRDSDPNVRSVIAALLARLDQNSSRAGEIDKHLHNMLSDTEANVRVAVLEGLGKRDAPASDSRLYAAVRERLADDVPLVAVSACQLIAHWTDAHASAELQQLSLDSGKHTGVRVAAIRALVAQRGIDAEVLKSLQKLARDKAEPVRLAALSALLTPATVEPPPGTDGGSLHRTLDYFHELICSVPEVEHDTPPNAGEQTDVTGQEHADGQQGVTGQEHADGQQDITLQMRPDEQQDGTGPNEPGACDVPPPATVSTLDTILRDNERIALKTNKSADYDPFVQADELSEDIQEFADVVRQTVREREVWFDKNKVSTASDARHLATRLLGECADDGVISTLLCALNDPGSELRREAADSLARIAERNPQLPAFANAWGALVTHLKSDGRSVRLSCARTLGALGQRKSIAILVEALDDEDPSVRTGVIAALSRLVAACSADHPKRVAVVRRIKEKLHDAEDGPRRAAAVALLDLGDEETLHTTLGSLIRSKNSLGPAIRIKLHAMRSQAEFEKHLVDILARCSDSSERRPVIECIGEIYQVREPDRWRAEDQMA